MGDRQHRRHRQQGQHRFGIATAARALAALAMAVTLLLLTGCGAEQSGDGVASSVSLPTAGSVDPSSGLPWVDRSQLPPQALDTIAEIAAGPPYPFDQDGTTFENREGILPQEDNGYYEEFTVVTPGSSDRGARRIIAGSGGELYYTDDHYASFARIAP